MDANNAAFEMMQDARLSTVQLSHLMGRDRSYISTTIGRGHIPRSDILAEIAYYCGYDLLAKRRADGHEIHITFDE